jgi:hypothetical protein
MERGAFIWEKMGLCGVSGITYSEQALGEKQ